MGDFVDVGQKFLFLIAQALLPILAGYVVVFVKKFLDLQMAKLEQNNPTLADGIRQAVSLAVKAAEQAGAAGLIEDKKDYAIAIAQRWLDEQGWDEFDVDILEAAIEAEVLRLFNSEPDRLKVADWDDSAW